MDEQRYWLALSVCNGIGPARFRKLLHHFGSAKIAWNASVKELIASGIGEKMAGDVIDFRKKFSLEEYEERMQKLGVSYVTLQDITYPNLLKEIPNPPNVLYQKGALLNNESSRILSVVGTRRVTESGKEVTILLVTDLVAAGCVIVSGLAMGVDAVAHSATIAAGGRTIAVLGSGVDFCTPQENSKLYDQILESGGTIISESPLGQMPNKGSFPARNRIIAGLALGVVVTEGAEDSGSLITANDAFAYQRKVFAVPGPITSSVSKGPIALIAKGARIVMRSQDILEELQIASVFTSTKTGHLKGETKDEQQIITLLQDQSLHFDELIKRTSLPSSQLGTLLSLMEVKGLVRSLDAGFFGLTS